MRNLISIFFFFFLLGATSLHGQGSQKLGEYYFYPDFQPKANIQDDHLYKLGTENSEFFWAECAKEISWFSPWNNILRWDPPSSYWFEGGKLNACYNCLDRHLEEKGDQIALIWCGESGAEKHLTYHALYEEVCRFSNALKRLGVQKGDRIAIYMPMIPEAIVSMLASARIGAVHSVVFGGTGAGSLKEKIQDAEAKVLITADGGFRRGKIISYKTIADEIADECSSLEKIVVVEHTNQGCTFKSERDLSYGDLIANESSNCPPEWMDAEDLLFILYTSGTTGKPKGIMHTTGGYLVGVHNTFKWVFDLKSTDIYFCTADVGWITGHSYIVYGPMSNGVSQIIYEGAPDYPNKARLWNLIEKHQATIFYTAPTLIRSLMKWGTSWLADKDLSSLRLLGSIGEPLNPEAWLWYHQYIGQERCPIVDTWFQTETGAFVMAPIPGLTPLKPGSVTKALPGFKVDVLDESGYSVNTGYLSITQPFPSMLRGIYKNSERYFKTYWKQWDGRYYFAGDLAKKDDDSYIWVLGRSDEVIKIAGHRVGTAEIECALLEHSAVAEGACIGVTDQIKGQTIVAVVVLKEEAPVGSQTKQQIISVVEKYLGSYVKPEVVAFISDLPKTKSGKILRRLIRNMIEGEEIGDITTLENKQIMPELTEVCRLIREELLSNRNTPQNRAVKIATTRK